MTEPAETLRPNTAEAEVEVKRLCKVIKATRVRIGRQTLAAIIEIGTALINVKRLVARGRWLECCAKCEMSERTAQNYMRLARNAKSEIISGLDPKVGYAEALKLIGASKPVIDALDVELGRQFGDAADDLPAPTPSMMPAQQAGLPEPMAVEASDPEPLAAMPLMLPAREEAPEPPALPAATDEAPAQMEAVAAEANDAEQMPSMMPAREPIMAAVESEIARPLQLPLDRDPKEIAGWLWAELGADICFEVFQALGHLLAAADEAAGEDVPSAEDRKRPKRARVRNWTVH